MKIELNSYDLQISETRDGDLVAQIRPQLAFDESFIAEMRSLGVKDYIKVVSNE